MTQSKRLSPEKIRLIFVDLSGACGGAERSMAELALVLAHNEEIDVSVAMPQGKISEELSESGVDVFSIPRVRLRRLGFRRLKCAFSGLLDLLTARRVIARRLAVRRDGELPIVVANSFSALLATVSFPCRAKIWHVRDMPRKSHIRCGAALANKLIAISIPVAKALRDALPAKSADQKVILLENGIDLERVKDVIPPHPILQKIPKETPLVAMVAHIVPWKRHEIFIKAGVLVLKKIQEAHTKKPPVFLIVGRDNFNENSAYSDELNRLIEKSGFPRHFIRIEDLDTIAAIFPRLALLVHPADCEPFGRVICEAMAAGKPVIVSDRGGGGSLVSDNETGRTVKGDNAENWANAIVAALSDLKTTKAMADRASVEAERRFDVKRVAREMANLIKELYESHLTA